MAEDGLWICPNCGPQENGLGEGDGRCPTCGLLIMPIKMFYGRGIDPELERMQRTHNLIWGKRWKDDND